MWAAAIQLIALALALAVSSVPIMVAITVMLTARRVSVPFAVGLVVGLAVVLTLFTLTGQLLPDRPREAAQVTQALKVTIGLVLLLFGVGTLGMTLRRRRQERPPRPSRFGDRHLNGPSAFGLAALLDVRPKSVVICATAGLVLYGAGAEVPAMVGFGIVFVAIACAPVIGLVTYASVAPAKADRLLQRLREWLTRNGGMVSALALIAIGGYMIVNGLLDI